MDNNDLTETIVYEANRGGIARGRQIPSFERDSTASLYLQLASHTLRLELFGYFIP